MNTREREVLDALADALREYVEYDRKGWQVPLAGASDALVAYDALLAEGAAGDQAKAVGHIISSYEVAGKGFVHTASFNPHVLLPHGTRLYTDPQLVQGEPESGLHDGYEGAREGLRHWKGRAKRAEARLRNLGWTGADASEPPQGEHERRPIADKVCELCGNAECFCHDSPAIADEVLLPPLPEPTCLGFRNPCGITQLPDMGIYGYTADQVRECQRAAIESALPRGLPAGSDAKFGVGVDATRDGVHVVVSRLDVDGTSTIVHSEFVPLATAEQPSCGQDSSLTLDARDAARWRALLTCARIRILGHAGFLPDGQSRKAHPEYRHFGAEFWTHHDAGNEQSDAADIISQFADAAIAAQQRQGGGWNHSGDAYMNKYDDGGHP